MEEAHDALVRRGVQLLRNDIPCIAQDESCASVWQKRALPSFLPSFWERGRGGGGNTFDRVVWIKGGAAPQLAIEFIGPGQSRAVYGLGRQRRRR